MEAQLSKRRYGFFFDGELRQVCLQSGASDDSALPDLPCRVSPHPIARIAALRRANQPRSETAHGAHREKPSECALLGPFRVVTTRAQQTAFIGEGANKVRGPPSFDQAHKSMKPDP